MSIYTPLILILFLQILSFVYYLLSSLVVNLLSGHKYGKTSLKTFPPTGAATPPPCVKRRLLQLISFKK